MSDVAHRSPTDMTGQVVTVFGAGPGIGSASARALADAGATVVCVDRDEQVAQTCAAMVKERGATSSAYLADVLDRGQVHAALARAALEHGSVDGVVNVVGRAHATPTANLSDADWVDQLDINLRHHFIVAQEATPYLIQHHGSYVAIGSFNGLSTSRNATAYGVAKAGLIALIRNLALDYGPQGARYNVVAPGLVLTDRARQLGMTEGAIGAAFREKIPLGRPAEPDDVGHAVLFLLSRMAKHITGQTVVVDGGSSLNYFLPDIPVPDPSSVHKGA